MKKKEAELEATVILLANEVRTQGEWIDRLEQVLQRHIEMTEAGQDQLLELMAKADKDLGRLKGSIENLAATVKREEQIVTKHDNALLQAGILEYSFGDEKPVRVN